MSDADTEDFPKEGSVRPKQVMQFLGISSTTLWRWCNEGRLPRPSHVFNNPRMPRWRAEDIRKIYEETHCHA